ncbi:MAG: hypothetical protein IIC02_07765, partial [Planctomycetes bacterium]|nr:hypothetical protein [Planctomycetota bacterium]
MQLDLRVGEGVVEHFDSGWLPVEQLAGIHIAVSMNGMVCFDTVLGIVAEPVPPNQIKNYSLVEGSTYQRGCFDPCDCPLEAQRQMVGTFDLVPLSDNGTWAEFAVVNVDLMALSSSLNDVIPIAGFGVYQRFAEFAVQHRLSLDLIVGDENRTHFDSGLVVTNVPFPRIDIVVTVNEMVCFDTVLHIVADPSGGTVCGGFAGIPCPANEFCKFPIGTCQFDDIFGVCAPIPNACPENFDPVCGCNGVTYDNECFSDAAGVSVNHPGVCEVGACCMPDGTCVELPFEVCFAEGGDPHPTGAPCDPSLCPGPLTGACCLDDFAGNLTCVETTEEVCIAERGQFLGPGTDCPPDGICIPPEGACCFPDGLCLDLPMDICQAAGAEWLPGTSCELVDCAPSPIGACCLGGLAG